MKEILLERYMSRLEVLSIGVLFITLNSDSPTLKVSALVLALFSIVISSIYQMNHPLKPKDRKGINEEKLYAIVNINAEKYRIGLTSINNKI